MILCKMKRFVISFIHSFARSLGLSVSRSFASFDVDAATKQQRTIVTHADDGCCNVLPGFLLCLCCLFVLFVLFVCIVCLFVLFICVVCIVCLCCLFVLFVCVVCLLLLVAVAGCCCWLLLLVAVSVCDGNISMIMV